MRISNVCQCARTSVYTAFVLRLTHVHVLTDMGDPHVIYHVLKASGVVTVKIIADVKTEVLARC